MGDQRESCDRKGRVDPERIIGWLTGVGIVTALVVVVALADFKKNIPQTKSPSGNIVVGFDPPLFDFGVVPQGHFFEQKFRLVNRSTNDTSISLVKANCDCTVVATNYVGKILRAGDELVVPITFDSGTKEGYVQTSVVFLLDSLGGRYKAEAKLSGRVEPEFFLERSALDFGFLFPGQSATQTVVLRPGRFSGAPLIETQVNLGPFHVLVTNQINDGERKTNAALTVTFSAPPLTQREQFSNRLKLETRSERYPNVEIELKALVVPEVEITPELLVLSPGDTSGESRFSVRTRLPSRIISALSRSAERTSVLEVARSGDTDSGWQLSHRFLVVNSVLADATQVDVELEVRTAAGGTEARLASAQIKSLAKEKKGTNEKDKTK